MRLIDADALIADLDRGLWGKDYDKALAEAIIRDAPSIDIVRCKDCEHYNAMTHGCKRNPCVEPWEENDFCSYGERKEREGE